MSRACDQCSRVPEVMFAIMANGTQLCQGCYMHDHDTAANIARLTGQVAELKAECNRSENRRYRALKSSVAWKECAKKWRHIVKQVDAECQQAHECELDAKRALRKSDAQRNELQRMLTACESEKKAIGIIASKRTTAERRAWDSRVKREKAEDRVRVLEGALRKAEAALSDIGDSEGPDEHGKPVTREWHENRARETLPIIRAALTPPPAKAPPAETPAPTMQVHRYWCKWMGSVPDVCNCDFGKPVARDASGDGPVPLTNETLAEWKEQARIGHWIVMSDARGQVSVLLGEIDRLRADLDDAWKAAATPVRGMVSLAEVVSGLRDGREELRADLTALEAVYKAAKDHRVLCFHSGPTGMALDTALAAVDARRERSK